MNHRTSPTRSPHTDTITSQLNPVGAAILCRVCKECDVFRLPISDSACTVPLPCARKRSRTVSRHSQRVFYLTALGEGQRRGFSRHAFHPQPKTLRKLSSSLRRLAREQPCRQNESRMPFLSRSFLARPERSRRARVPLQEHGFNRANMTVVHLLPIARLTRAKYSPFLASLLLCLSPHQNLTAPAPCRRAHGDSRHPTP